jgi:hypothetical protein
MSVQDRVDALQASVGDGERERFLVAADVALVGPHKTTNAGKNETQIVVLHPGRRAYFKPFAGQLPRLARQYGHEPVEVPLNEVTAWRLAEALGDPYVSLVPPAVLRTIEGRGGALIDEMPGDPHRLVLDEAKPQIFAAAVWDALVGQRDRHMVQYRYDADRRRLGLIDHGYAFARPGDRLNASTFLAHRRSVAGGALTTRETEALERLAGDDDLLGLRALLGPDRADALAGRAERMAGSGMLLLPGDF